MEAPACVGRRGEDAAARMYERGGCIVLDRNFRCRGGEIDLVVADGATLVFCEVKARTGSRWGYPAEAVRSLKQLRVRRAAVEWMRRHRPSAQAVRFDVVSVIVGTHAIDIEHIPDAF